VQSVPHPPHHCLGVCLFSERNCSQIAAGHVSATTAFDRRYGRHRPETNFGGATPPPALPSQVTITPRSAAVYSNINNRVYNLYAPVGDVTHGTNGAGFLFNERRPTVDGAGSPSLSQSQAQSP